jgi:hypothetical protein
MRRTEANCGDNTRHGTKTVFSQPRVAAPSNRDSPLHRGPTLAKRLSLVPPIAHPLRTTTPLETASSRSKTATGENLPNTTAYGFRAGNPVLYGYFADQG